MGECAEIYIISLENYLFVCTFSLCTFSKFIWKDTCKTEGDDSKLATALVKIWDNGYSEFSCHVIYRKRSCVLFGSLFILVVNNNKHSSVLMG